MLLSWLFRNGPATYPRYRWRWATEPPVRINSGVSNNVNHLDVSVFDVELSQLIL